MARARSSACGVSAWMHSVSKSSGNAAPPHRDHFPLSGKPLRLLRGLLDRQQCVGVFPADQRSIRHVAAIGERLADDVHPMLPGHERHLRCVAGNDRDRLIDGGDGIDQNFRERTLSMGIVVQRAVRLDPLQRDALPFRDPRECRHLMDERLAQLARFHGHRPAPEVLAIRIGRVGAEDDASLRGETGRLAHAVVVAGVAAAGDVGGVDQQPKPALDRAPRFIRSFAEVTTELDHAAG